METFILVSALYPAVHLQHVRKTQKPYESAGNPSLLSGDAKADY